MENNVPEDFDPIFAAGNPFSGGNSRLARSMRARRQLRDRRGRFIKMGGGLKTTIRNTGGKQNIGRDSEGRFVTLEPGTYPITGRSVGASDMRPEGVQVYVENDPNGLPDGFYTVPSTSTDVAEAILTPEQLERAGIPDIQLVDDTLDSGVVNAEDILYSDAPEGWTKRPSGAYSTVEDNYTIEKTEDGQWQVLDDEIPIGTYKDLPEAFTAVAKIDSESELSDSDKKKVADLREAGDEEGADKVISNEPVARLPEDAPAPVNMPPSDGDGGGTPPSGPEDENEDGPDMTGWKKQGSNWRKDNVVVRQDADGNWVVAEARPVDNGDGTLSEVLARFEPNFTSPDEAIYYANDIMSGKSLEEAKTRAQERRGGTPPPREQAEGVVTGDKKDVKDLTDDEIVTEYYTVGALPRPGILGEQDKKEIAARDEALKAEAERRGIDLAAAARQRQLDAIDRMDAERPMPSEGLINEDIAQMTRDEVTAEAEKVNARIAEIRALPENDQDPAELDALSERLTDISLRNQDLDALDRGEDISAPENDGIAGWLESVEDNIAAPVSGEAVPSGDPENVDDLNNAPLGSIVSVTGWDGERYRNGPKTSRFVKTLVGPPGEERAEWVELKDGDTAETFRNPEETGSDRDSMGAEELASLITSLQNFPSDGLKVDEERNVEDSTGSSFEEEPLEGYSEIAESVATLDDGLGTDWADQEWRNNAPDGAAVEVNLPEEFGGIEATAYKYNGRWYVAQEGGGGAPGETDAAPGLFDDITDENWFLDSETNISDQGGTPESVQKAYDEVRPSLPANIPAPTQQAAEPPVSEALINNDIAAMNKEALDAEDSRVRARIAEIRELPEEDQDLDELDDLSERLTDISLRNQDLDAFNRGESISGPAVFSAPGDTATEESVASAPNGTVIEGLSTVVVSNDGTSRETVPARAYKKNGQWFMYADKDDSPVFDQIGFPEKVNKEVDPDSVLDGTFGEPNSIEDAAVTPNEDGIFVITSLGQNIKRNYGGDTNDIATLQRRLDRAQARLERMGNDIMGRFSDEDMAEIDLEIESLAARIEALNNGEDLPVDAPVDLPEIRSVTAEAQNPDAYETDVAALESATTASEQTEIATEIAVKADKNGDSDVATTAATVVSATKVQEEAETVNTEPGYKKKLTAFAAKLLERLEGSIEKEQSRQRRALARKDVKTADSAQRRIDALNRTLDFMNLKTSEVDDYDPRGTREYVLANTTLDEASIERDEEGNLTYATGIYVAPTGVAYRMVYNPKFEDKDPNTSIPQGKRGSYAYLINDLVDPETGRVIEQAGSLAGILHAHYDDEDPESDASPVISSRDGIPELDGGTRYIIPGYINAIGADPRNGTPSPFKAIGSGLHGWTAAMATLDGRQYQHSSWLYPNGRAASHRFHTTQAKFHSRSQREKFFDLLKSPTTEMMRKLGYYKGGKPNGLTSAQFNKDPDGKLRAGSNDRVWWGDFDRHVDTNIAKFALVMFQKHGNNPDAVPGVDYPKFLQEYIKGGDHTKIEQLSLADVLHTLNYEGGDRSAVATKLRNVMEELQEWADNNVIPNFSSDGWVSDVSRNWTGEAPISGSVKPAIDVLNDVVGYLEDPGKKLGKPLAAPTESDTTLAAAPSKGPASQIEALPELDAQLGLTQPDRIFNPENVDADNVKDLVSAYTEQELKDSLEDAIRRGSRLGTLPSRGGSAEDTYGVADIAAALNERGIDDYRFVADIYDSIAGNSTNKDSLDAYYERNRSMLPETPITPIETKYILAPLMKNESYDGLKYAMDPEAYTPVGTDVPGTSDDPKTIAETFSVSSLRTSFLGALFQGEGQIRLQFPGAAEGEEGPSVNVPVEAVRDALQLRGVNTNLIAKRQAEISSLSDQGREEREQEETAVDTSNVPATPASVGSTPTPETSVTVEPNDGMADTTANPTTGATQASDVDLSDNDGVDAYDPEVIMQVIRNEYPDAVEMANGDLIVDSHETTDASGNRIEYQTVVVRTRQEFFYTYIRRINHAETDPNKKYQSLRYGRMSQSARALNNTIIVARARARTQGGTTTMNQWWGMPAQRGRIQMESVNPDTNEPEHIREQPIDRETVQRIVAATSDEAVSEEMVRGIFRHITQHGASQTVLNRLRAQFGMTRESMNTIVDQINEHVAKQDRIRRFDTWVSADGETPLFEGDTVRHADGRVGVVVRRIIEHRTHDYGYSDYLYIRFPGRRSDTNMTSRRLTLVSTAGGTDGSERRGPGAIQLPDPTLTVRAQNRMRREGRLNDFAPEQLQTDRFSGPLPTVTIDGNSYPIRGSRQTVIGDNMDTVSGDLSTAQVGDFTTTYDPESGSLRVREIVGIEQNPDGTTTIFTFTPNDFGSGTAEGTTYTPDENGNFGRSVPLYRELLVEDTGLATQRDRETLGTAVSEADPESIPENLKTRVTDIMSPNSTATSREVNDTAIEVSQLPKQEGNAPDSIPLETTRSILTDVKAEAPGDSTINLDTIQTAGGLEGQTIDDKMADAPAWFKNPMTPEAIDEKMGPASATQTPGVNGVPPTGTVPMEELATKVKVGDFILGRDGVWRKVVDIKSRNNEAQREEARRRRRYVPVPRSNQTVFFEDGTQFYMNKENTSWSIRDDTAFISRPIESTPENRNPKPTIVVARPEGTPASQEVPRRSNFVSEGSRTSFDYTNNIPVGESVRVDDSNVYTRTDENTWTPADGSEPVSHGTMTSWAALERVRYGAGDTTPTPATETPATSTRPEMPPVTTPFEELPDEESPNQIPEGESSTPVRTPDVIQREISETKEKLSRARAAREAMGDDPIVAEALDSRIADLVSQLNDLNTELSQETSQGAELDPDELPLGVQAPTAPAVGDPVDGAFINGSPVGTEITTVINGQKVTFKKNADGTWVTIDVVSLPEMDLQFTPAPLSNEQMAARADGGNVQLGGEGPSDGGNGGGGQGPKAPTPDSSGGGGQASPTPTSQPISLDSSEVTAANEAVASYSAGRATTRPSAQELRDLPVGAFILFVSNGNYARYTKTGPDRWERRDVRPNVGPGGSTIDSTVNSQKLAATLSRKKFVAPQLTVRPIDNTNGSLATSTTVGNALPGFVIHNNTTGEEFTKQEDGTWVSSQNDIPISDFQMVTAVGENVHSFSGRFFIGPKTATTPNPASTADIAQYDEAELDSSDIPGWRKATYEEVYERALSDAIARWEDANEDGPSDFELMYLRKTLQNQLKNYDFYINGTVEIGIGKKFNKDADYVKQFIASVEELRVNSPLDQVRVLLSDSEGDAEYISGAAMFSQLATTGATVIKVRGKAFLRGDAYLTRDGTDNEGFFSPSYGSVPDIQYVLTHEWGHAVDYASGATMREQLWKLIEANPELKRQLNTYAASEPAEAFAELFAQLYLQRYHGAAPTELSKLIEKVLG